MSLVPAKAAVGLWVDCDTIGTLTPARLRALLAYEHEVHGKVKGVIAYAPLPGERVDGTLWTPDALELVTVAGGLQASWIGHPLKDGWLPSEHLGALHEASVSDYTTSLGFPLAMHGWCDIEGCGGSSLGYGLTWSTNRVQRGGKAGAYNGWKLGQTLEQLAEAPDFTSYWCAFNQMPTPGRGPAIRQGPTIDIPGFGPVDIDVVSADAKGELPLVAQAA